MRVKANRGQIIRNIANIIKNDSKKIKQLEAVQSISVNCTSDDHINIKCELYYSGIVRYLIEGTRSGMTVAAIAATGEIVRKKRGEKPWCECETDCWASDILEIVRGMERKSYKIEIVTVKGDKVVWDGGIGYDKSELEEVTKRLDKDNRVVSYRIKEFGR